MLKRAWLLGLIVSLAFTAATLYGVPFLQNMEHLAYDTGVKLTPSDPASTKGIAIVAKPSQPVAIIMINVAYGGQMRKMGC